MGKNANRTRDYSMELVSSQNEPRPKKSFHSKDLCALQARSDNQEGFIDSYLNTDVETFGLFGYPGTGKSFLAIRCGLEDVLSKDYEQDRMIIFRSAVNTRDVGYLPGTEQEKAESFAKPYYGLMDDVFGNKFTKTYQNLIELGKLRFETTSNQRGVTYDNSVFVVDEAQNMTYEELKTIYTRAGRNCRIIFCGDIGQNDLTKKKNDVTGLPKWINVLNKMDDSVVTEFYSLDDIVRDGRIRRMIEAEIDLGYC